MSKKHLLILILIISIISENYINGQVGISRIEKILISRVKKDKTKFSTWDFHKPNIITYVKIHNTTKDTIRFVFTPPNCNLFIPYNEKWEKFALNFAYNDTIDSIEILPDSSKKLSLRWLINQDFFLKIKKNKLEFKMRNTHIKIDLGLNNIVLVKTKKIVIRE